MIRPYLANGTLVVTAKPHDTTVYVDNDTWAYLNGIFSGSCYLVLGGKEPVEVLDVVAPNALLVERRIETDNRNSWPVGTRIKYEVTASEILAATPDGDALTISTQGFVKFDGSMLSYYQMTIYGIGGIKATGDNATGEWRIEDIPANAGCECGLPPTIPLVYEKLRITGSGAYRITGDGSYRRYG